MIESQLPNIPSLEEIIAKAMPSMPLAKGTVTATVKGWARSFYYDPLTGKQVRFSEVPTVVAVIETREGQSPVVAAPTISIPTILAIEPTSIDLPTIPIPKAPDISIPNIDLPTASTIIIPSMDFPAATAIVIPSITLPETPVIDVPEPAIPWLAESFPGFFTDFAPLKPLVDTLNSLRNMLYTIQGSAYNEGATVKGGGINLVIYYVNTGLKLARKAVLDTITYIRNLRTNIQTAMNTYRDNIQTSVNNGLADARNKTQAALSTYRNNIQASVNNGLADARAKTQTALNLYRDAIQDSVNKGLINMKDILQYVLVNYHIRMKGAINSALADSRAKTQEALNIQRDNIQKALNAGLSTVIPMLYEQIGLPTDQLISPVSLRNVTTESFEFYALSPGIKLHYVAIGKRRA